MKIWGMDLIPSVWDVLQEAAKFFGKKTAAAAAGGEGNPAAGLKAGLFGFGTIDESLYLDAVALGHARGEIDDAGLTNLRQLWEGLNVFEKDRLGKIVGLKEDEVKTTTSTPAFKPDGSPLTDKNGQVYSKKEESSHGNLRGLRLLKMLSKMQPPQAEQFLRASGVLDGPMKTAEELWGMLYTFATKPETIASLRRVGVTGVTVYNWTHDRLEAATVQYFGAADIADARRIADQRLADAIARREESWFKRDAQNRSGLLIAWGGMLIFIIGGTIYVLV